MTARTLSLRDTQVAADEVGFHGGSLLGQILSVVRGLSLVLAVVNADGAGVATAVREAFVERVRPAAAAAEACDFGTSHISRRPDRGWWRKRRWRRLTREVQNVVHG